MTPAEARQNLHRGDWCHRVSGRGVSCRTCDDLDAALQAEREACEKCRPENIWIAVGSTKEDAAYADGYNAGVWEFAAAIRARTPSGGS